MSEENQLNMEEIEALEQLGYGYPKAEEKPSVFTWFKRIDAVDDNTKTANLTEDEIGAGRTPVRTNQEISLMCDSFGMKGFAQYFKQEAQIMLGTSLSRDGFLNELAVTQKRESRIRTPKPTKNKGWFTPKEKINNRNAWED